MKKILLIVTFLVTSFTSMIYSQSNHTITIDGNNDFNTTNEQFANITAADNAYFTWDENYIYFGISGLEADYGNMTTFLYFDTDPVGNQGSNSAYAWDNYISVPFKADFVLAYRNSSDYLELLEYDNNTTNWVQIVTNGSNNYNSGEIQFAIGTDFREVKIKRSLLNDPNSIKICSFTEQQWGSQWRYFGWPSEGWTDDSDQANQSHTNYYGYLLTSNINQNNSNYYNADIKSFDGETNETWNTDANWSDDAEPSSSSLVVIPTDKSVTIPAETTVNAYDLLVLSDNTGTGSLKVDGTLNLGGTFASERYMAGIEIWRLVSSPVASQSISGTWTPSGTYPDASGYDFYAYQESSATWLNQKVGANSITSFTPGQGYLVAFQAENPTKSFEGELNNGDVSISVSKTGTGDYAGANLIGNPYPSGIDWNDADRSLFSDDFAYVYDRESNPGHPTYEGYRLVDGTQPDAYIAPHQGFFVIKKDAGSSDFTFTNAMRGHGGTFTKAPANFSGLKLKVSNGSYYDIATININETASFDRDRMDAIKFYSNNANMPNFYTISKDSKQLAINTIPSIQIEEPIVIGITVPANGAYEISLNEQGADFADKVIYLEDLLTGIRHNLTADGIYSYSASTSDDPNRFLLHFGVVGIGEQEQAPTLQAYLVDNRLYVNNSLEQAQLAVYDLQGRLVAEQSLNTAGLQSLPLELPAGMYIVRLNNASESRVVKINLQ